jgi:phosphate transport system substrate-binding protein
VPLSISDGTACSDTSAEAAYLRKYPLACHLKIYVNKKPDAPLDPVHREFIKYILSRDGQTEMEAGGFYSITNADGSRSKKPRNNALSVIGASVGLRDNRRSRHAPKSLFQ